MVLEGIGLGVFDVGVQEIGFGGEAGGDEVDDFADDGGGESGEVSAGAGVGHV